MLGNLELFEMELLEASLGTTSPHDELTGRQGVLFTSSASTWTLITDVPSSLTFEGAVAGAPALAFLRAAAAAEGAPSVTQRDGGVQIKSQLGRLALPCNTATLAPPRAPLGAKTIALSKEAVDALGALVEANYWGTLQAFTPEMLGVVLTGTGAYALAPHALLMYDAALPEIKEPLLLPAAFVQMLRKAIRGEPEVRFFYTPTMVGCRSGRVQIGAAVPQVAAWRPLDPIIGLVEGGKELSLDLSIVARQKALLSIPGGDTVQLRSTGAFVAGKGSDFLAAEDWASLAESVTVSLRFLQALVGVTPRLVRVGERAIALKGENYRAYLSRADL